LVEQRIENPRVVGSIPTPGTTSASPNTVPIEPTAVAQVLREAVNLADALMNAAELTEAPAQRAECRTVARQVWQAAARLQAELPDGDPEWAELRPRVVSLEQRLKDA
jgi:hypothetical protein